MKTSKAFQIWTHCVENKWERNGVPLGGKKLVIATEVYDMRLPCSKLNNSDAL